MHHLLTTSLLLSLLGAYVSASPLTRRDGDYSKILRQAVNASTPKDGSAALLRAYQKYGWAPPVTANTYVTTNGPSTAPVNEKLATGDSSGGEGTVTATPYVHDSEYLVPVTIGGQTMNLNLDTGSSDLWVFNTGLPASDTQNRTVYNPTESKTYSNIAGATFGVNYGDGSQTYGNVGVDTVAVGGISVTDQAIELPTGVSPSFTKDMNSEGILGLGFTSLNGIKPNPQPTFIENALSTLQAPLFTANLKANAAGNYQFGVIDHTAYTGSINYTPINKTGGLWQFQTKAGHSPGIADTGSSLLLLDDDIVSSYWSQVEGHTSDDQGIIFPCQTKLPDFQIELGATYKATVPGTLLNYTTATGQSGYCFGGIQSNNGQQLNIFGDILFASQFAVFDVGNSQIGFAPHAA